MAELALIALGAAALLRVLPGPPRPWLAAFALLTAIIVVARSKRARGAEETAGDPGGAFAAMVHATSDLVCTITPEGLTVFLNAAGHEMLGARQGEEPPPAARLLPGWDRLAALAAREGQWRGEAIIQQVIGTVMPVSLVVTAHPGPPARVEYYSVLARDISERKKFEDQLVHIANHDALTGLLNRRRFDERLESYLSSARRAGAHGALLFVDLDGFKRINDTLGHPVGDRLLAGIADRLKQAVSMHSTVVARLGGDEFAVLLPGATRDVARGVARELVEAIAAYRLSVLDESVGLTASVGVARYPDDGATSLELVAHADFAMYDAKERKGTFTEFKVDRPNDALLDGWTQRLERALSEDLFVVHAQEVVSTRGGLAMHELLVRLSTDNGVLLAPGVFLPIAERAGLSARIDRWMVEQAIALAARCHLAGMPAQLAVNLSSATIQSPGFPAWVAAEAAEAGVATACLIFEISESGIVADLDRARAFVAALRDAGFQVTVDDFGGGFSTAGYLEFTRPDYVKLDGSLIDGLVGDAMAQQQMQGLITAAHAVGARAIAKSISEPAALRLLRSYGVEYVQGFHIGEPLALWQVFGRAGRAEELRKAS